MASNENMSDINDVSERLRELFRKLRLGAPAWIDVPLQGISEAADMAEGYVGAYPELFWNTPPRQGSASDASYVSRVINRLKAGNRDAAGCALRLILFLEEKNVK
ncbi:MAG: hypothetical protein LBH28_02325 [Oscillospiraceae bacterium]|jgi:hypothetical protein|nr:hypothetical protein [Oscillospiraceae bacterium]